MNDLCYEESQKEYCYTDDKYDVSVIDAEDYIYCIVFDDMDSMKEFIFDVYCFDPNLN